MEGRLEAALMPSLTVSAELALPETGRRELASVLAAYQDAFRRCASEVELLDQNELAFRVSLRAPERLGLKHPDLGLVSEGTLAVVPTAAGYRVYLHARPRTWFLLLSLAPWLLLIWGLGLTSAPWSYLMAFGGLPLFALMWVVVWANLHAFLDHTNATLRASDPPDGAAAAPAP